MSQAVGKKQQSRLDATLAVVERVGDKIPHPFVLFLWLFAIIAIVSTVMQLLHVSVTVPGSNTPTAVKGLLTMSGLIWFLENFVDNFMSFPPLGNVLVMLLAIGVAEQSGFLRAVIVATFSRAPRALLPYVVAFVAAQGHVMSDPSMIVIPPLAAVVFMAAGRHPLAGMIGAFTCTSAGYSSGILLGSLDALLAGLTNKAAAVVGSVPVTPVTIASNWYFSAATGIILPLIGGYLIDRVLEPRLGPWRQGDEDGVRPLERHERRALLVAVLATVVVAAAAVVAWLVPGSPLRGKGGVLVPSPFLSGLVPLLVILFLVGGVTYGVVSKAITRAADVPTMMAESARQLAGYIVFIFIASQVIAIFTWSGVGTVIAVTLADLLDTIGLTGFGAVLGLVVIASLLNLFIISGSAMWALMAPVIVPTFVLVGIEPGFTQAAYRIGDSTTQVLTPLNPYIVVLLGFARRYQPDLTFGSLIAKMAVFVPPFWIVWVIVLAVFYFAGIPVGPGMPILLGR